MTAQPYTSEYYSGLKEGARRSARVVVPLVLEHVQPRSVIDVGCGQGTWLAVFREHGIEDVVGVDGDYIERAQLDIPAERYLARDLSQPLALDRTFDLVVSLEVAEHLPPDAANTFVASLVGLGPVVLFSAAAPFQGGQQHFNEQWPAYWAERFTRHGYLPVDCLRRRLWSREDVQWWYAQNTFLYVERSHLSRHERLLAEHTACPAALSLVHPRRYLEWIEWGLSVASSPYAGQPPHQEDEL